MKKIIYFTFLTFLFICCDKQPKTVDNDIYNVNIQSYDYKNDSLKIAGLQINFANHSGKCPDYGQTFVSDANGYFKGTIKIPSYSADDICIPSETVYGDKDYLALSVFVSNYMSYSKKLFNEPALFIKYNIMKLTFINKNKLIKQINICNKTREYGSKEKSYLLMQETPVYLTDSVQTILVPSMRDAPLHFIYTTSDKVANSANVTINGKPLFQHTFQGQEVDTVTYTIIVN